MGAGCYYTNKYYDRNNREQHIKAVWLDIDLEEEYAYENELNNLFNSLKSVLNVNYDNDKDQTIETPMYKIWFESTYYGDGLIIKQESKFDDKYDLDSYEQKLKNIANFNFEKNYYSMLNKLCKLGYKFKIATSSYTSGEYNAN